MDASGPTKGPKNNRLHTRLSLVDSTKAFYSNLQATVA